MDWPTGCLEWSPIFIDEILTLLAPTVKVSEDQSVSLMVARPEKVTELASVLSNAVTIEAKAEGPHAELGSTSTRGSQR